MKDYQRILYDIDSCLSLSLSLSFSFSLSLSFAMPPAPELFYDLLRITYYLLLISYSYNSAVITYYLPPFTSYLFLLFPYFLTTPTPWFGVFSSVSSRGRRPGPIRGGTGANCGEPRQSAPANRQQKKTNRNHHNRSHHHKHHHRPFHNRHHLLISYGFHKISYLLPMIS